MLRVLQSPLPPLQLLLAIVGLIFFTALYCVGYTYFAGQPEGLGYALAWAATNLSPWFLAFEAGKRARGWIGRAAALALAKVASLGLEIILLSGFDSLSFEMLRRLPALIIVAAFWAVPTVSAALSHRRTAGTQPLAAADFAGIDWIRAAGNYVELHGGGRTMIERASLSALEMQLAPAGFIRIHRSLLVRRDRIARVRPLDVVLIDGTSLNIGKRYRSIVSTL